MYISVQNFNCSLPFKLVCRQQQQTSQRCTTLLSLLSFLCNQLISGKYPAVLGFPIPQHFHNPPTSPH